MQAVRRSSLAILAAIALAGCGGGARRSSSRGAGNRPQFSANNPRLAEHERNRRTGVQLSAHGVRSGRRFADVFRLEQAGVGGLQCIDRQDLRTPTAADVATYSNIRVTVSDGKGGSASTAMFAITVTDLGSGSVTLSWTPPTQNEDGSALTNLSGYEVRYGRTRRTSTARCR
jgi:hypothetical protein